MNISSFDIFDTCLLRKCGTPENFFDVFSLRVFNGEVEEWARQEFVAARYLAQQSVQSPSMKLKDIWDAFSWTYPLLKSKEELCQLEQETEREMLVAVLKMRDKVNECRERGHHIVFISDMYLPSSFLREVMQEHGFFLEGDGLYVSCECDAEKWNGKLFEYICEKEEVSFRHWHHYGDNKVGDYKAPRKLGIKATLVNHEYTPYQKQWVDNDYSLGFKYPSMLAGLGRALRYSAEWTTHTDFVLDIIAPFYCSLVWRMMKDAERRGIKRMFFCARDAHPLYCIALHFVPFFPMIECRYLYTSRQSLYEGNDTAKLKYFIQEGIATKMNNVAVVDVRSQGKTQRFLSDYLMQHGYQEVMGYYFEMFTLKEMRYFNPYYCEVNGAYLTMNRNLEQLLLYRWELYETFFSLNDFPKTVDYSIDSNGIAQPVFSNETDNEDSFCTNQSYWSKIHDAIINTFVEQYIKVGLAEYSNYIFEHVSTPTINAFMTLPKKPYLEALLEFFSYGVRDKKYVPYVKHLSFRELVIKRGRTGSAWRRASIIYSLPEWLTNSIIKHKMR